MQMELNGEEIQYLDQLLDRHMTGLIREINHTDSFEFKKNLRLEVDFLSGLKKRFEPTSPLVS